MAATSFIEVDDQVRILGIEVRWWIIEGNVPVFADAQECNIDRDRCQLFANFADHCGWIGGVAIEQVIMPDAGFLDQLLHEHLAEASWMRDGQTDVFI